MADIIITSIELGLLLSLAVFGVFITFRILQFPDLTVDGSFVAGAAVAAIAIRAGMPGIYAIFLGFLAGFLAGSITAFLHTYLKIGKILSGILTLTMLYTINLRIMNGPNVSLLNQKNIISYLSTPVHHFTTLLFLVAMILIVKFFLDWFLQTEFGLMLRATGDNELTAKSLGANIHFIKYIGLGLSNAFVGLCGALLGQYQGFVDINMGIGIIILGLACLMLGEALVAQKNISFATWAVILGTIAYQLIINISLRLGLAGTDLKFVTAFIVILSLLLGTNKKNVSYARRIFGN